MMPIKELLMTPAMFFLPILSTWGIGIIAAFALTSEGEDRLSFIILLCGLCALEAKLLYDVFCIF